MDGQGNESWMGGTSGDKNVFKILVGKLE